MKTIVIKTIEGIIAILTGMFTIIKHAFRPAITLEYPEQKPVLNSRYRGRPALRLNEDGSDPCIACELCAKVCPCCDLIQIEKQKNENNKLVATSFTIDLGRCISCGNCAEVCPTMAIIMIDDYEKADYSRESLVFDKPKLTLSIEESVKWKNRKDKDL